MKFFFRYSCEKLSVERKKRQKKVTKKMKMITLKNWKFLKEKKSNVKSDEKVSRQSFQEQMTELQKMQLKAFEESEKRQQQFF